MSKRNIIKLLNEKNIPHCVLKSYEFFKFDKSISCVEYLAVILRRDQTEELQEFSVMSENKMLTAVKLNEEEVFSLLRSKNEKKYIVVQDNEDGVVFEKENSSFREDYKRELSSISNNNLNKFEKVLGKNCFKEDPKNSNEKPKNRKTTTMIKKKSSMIAMNVR